MKNQFFAVAFCLFLTTICYSQLKFQVFFDSNKFELNKSELAKLNNWITANKDVKIIGANGFCDEDGSTILNDTLAKKRINTIYNILKTKLKFREDFKTHSFGELHTLSKIKSENRKVTLFYIQPIDFARENEILGIKSKAIYSIVRHKISFPDKIALQNPDGTKTEIKLDSVFMQQINLSKKGEKLNIQNLNFQVNTFIVLPESRSKLYELLIVLEKNPNLKIEIQGHLCCMPSDKQDLSTKRAKAVYSFLVYNQISKSRLSFKGLGSSEPIFPLPEKSETERASNRRVEILILEN